MHCTCGPHPRIDLTSAYSNYHRHLRIGGGGDIDDDGVDNRQQDTQLLSSCRQQIQSACQSHGCFHVTINLSYKDDDERGSNNNTASSPLTSSLPVDCLAKNSQQVEEDIESLFSPSFLQRVIQPNTLSNADTQNEADTNNNSNNHVYENICNGGLVEVNNVNGTTTSCTFRGRISESGDEEQSSPEPKLSWEYRRCIMANNNINNDNDIAAQPISSSSGFATVQSTDDGTSCDINSTNERANNDDPSNLLPKWTKALHSVASTIIHSLDIPSQLALQEESCRCSLNNSNAADTANKTDLATSSCQSKRCNIDLLRVFRYDAISSPQDNNNNDEQRQSMQATPTILGSSPHSDWGTLTVVYQDTKGGLQTYCHVCDKWSDVEAVSDVSTGTTTKKNDSRTCSLFVHVGDFLSLASINNEGESKSYPPKWPSPRHRVLCPTINEDRTNNSHHQSISSSRNVKDKADYCRRSLVYFAYPPPNVTLEDVKRVVSPLVAVASTPSSSSVQSTINDLEKDDNSCVEFYNHYSLLHNQSQQQSLGEKEEVEWEEGCSSSNGDTNNTTAAMQTYHQIKNIPFDKVISDKWNQVQRK